MRERQFYSQNQEDDYIDFENYDMFDLFSDTKEDKDIEDEKKQGHLNDDQKKTISEKIDEIFDAIVKESIQNLGNTFTDPWGDNKANQQDVIDKLINSIVEGFNKVCQQCGEWAVSDESGVQSYTINEGKAIESQADEILKLEKTLARLEKRTKLREKPPKEKTSEVNNTEVDDTEVNNTEEITGAESFETRKAYKERVKKEKKERITESNETHLRLISLIENPTETKESDSYEALEDRINELRNEIKVKQQELDSKRSGFINWFARLARNTTIVGIKETPLLQIKASDFILEDGTKFCVNPITRDDVYILLVPRAKDSPIDENKDGNYGNILALDGLNFAKEFTELSNTEKAALNNIPKAIQEDFNVNINLASEGWSDETKKWDNLIKSPNFDAGIKSLLLQKQLEPEGGVIQGTAEDEWKERQLKASKDEMEDHYKKILGEEAILPNDFYRWLTGLTSLVNTQNKNGDDGVKAFLKNAGVSTESIQKITDLKFSEIEPDDQKELIRQLLIYVSHLLVEEQKTKVYNEEESNTGKGRIKKDVSESFSKSTIASAQTGTYQKYNQKRFPEYGRRPSYEVPPTEFELGIESKIIWMLNYQIVIVDKDSDNQ